MNAIVSPRTPPLAAVSALPPEGLEALHTPPDPREAYFEAAAMLIESAMVLERHDPRAAARQRCAALRLRRAAREDGLAVEELAPSEPAATPTPAPEPKRERLHYPGDIRCAREGVIAWMHELAAQQPADRPAPSGREILRRADDEKLPWPRWILFEARNDQWPLAKPLKVPYPRGVRH
jgi:hypothetical protein